MLMFLAFQMLSYLLTHFYLEIFFGKEYCYVNILWETERLGMNGRGHQNSENTDIMCPLCGHHLLYLPSLPLPVKSVCLLCPHNTQPSTPILVIELRAAQSSLDFG